MYFSMNFAPNERGITPIIWKKSISNLLNHNDNARTYEAENYILNLFCNPLATKIDQPTANAVLFLSGRSAIYHLIRSNLQEQIQINGKAKKTEVIVQAFTCLSVVNSIINAGAKPIFVDITEDDFSMDTEVLCQKIGKNTGCVILQHTFGICPTNRKRIVDLCKKNDILLIEDSAHGIADFDQYEFPPLDDRKRSKHALLLSFGRSKQISTVFGAVVLTEDGDIYKTLKDIESSLPKASLILQTQCLLYKSITPFIKKCHQNKFNELGRITHWLGKTLALFPEEIDSGEKSNKHPTRLDCKYPYSLIPILMNEFEYFFNFRKKNVTENVTIYQEKFAKISKKSVNSPACRYPFLANSKIQKDIILSHLAKSNIFLGTWYDYPVSPKPQGKYSTIYMHGSCPVAEDICDRILNLPLLIEPDIATHIADQVLLQIDPHVKND
jgi:perosamine synthetase